MSIWRDDGAIRIFARKLPSWIKRPVRRLIHAVDRISKLGFLNAFETGSEARTGIGRWIGYYNADRPHSTFGGRTSDQVYAKQEKEQKLAA
jgi:Integrase core domain